MKEISPHDIRYVYLQDKPESIGKSLGILLLLFVTMMGFTSLITGLMQKFEIPYRATLLCGVAMQNLLVFLLSAYIATRVISSRPMLSLGLSVSTSWKAYIGVCIIFVVGMPFLDQVIWWNQNVSLGAGWEEVESIFRELEEQALQTTDVILSDKSVIGLIVEILLVGCLTGFCEEMFFRGTLQRILWRSPLGAHGAIWVTAFIFSLLHFQFYGFVPRFLLGAFFGYLFYWTWSIRVCAFAHALNNSIVVATTWAGADVEFEMFGVETSGVPVIALTSMVALGMIFIFFRTFFFFNTKRLRHG